MKKYIYLGFLLLPLFILSCKQTIADPEPENKAETFIGIWQNYIGDTWVFSTKTYERSLTWMGSVTYQDKGTLIATDNVLTITQEYLKPNGSGDWLLSDFISEFERSRNSYNEYLAGLGFGPLDTEGYWEVNYQWAQDELDGGTIGNPYSGYSEGMSLQEYKNSANLIYTASLTEVIPWIVSNNELQLVIDSTTEYYSHP